MKKIPDGNLDVHKRIKSSESGKCVGKEERHFSINIKKKPL